MRNNQTDNANTNQIPSAITHHMLPPSSRRTTRPFHIEPPFQDTIPLIHHGFHIGT